MSCGEKEASARPVAVTSTADLKWFKCQNNSQCVASFGPCGEWQALNRDYIKQQQAWAAMEGSALSCPENRNHKPGIACRNQTCTVTAPSGSSQ